MLKSNSEKFNTQIDVNESISNMEIRLAREKDLLQIIELNISTIKAIFPNYYSRNHIEFCIRHSKRKKIWFYKLYTCDFLVAELNGLILGYSSLNKNGKGNSALYIHKDFQRRGIGEKLLIARETYAKDHGVKKIYASALITSIPLLEKLGYKIVGKSEEGNSKVKFPIIIMEKCI